MIYWRLAAQGEDLSRATLMVRTPVGAPVEMRTIDVLPDRILKATPLLPSWEHGRVTCTSVGCLSYRVDRKGEPRLQLADFPLPGASAHVPTSSVPLVFGAYAVARLSPDASRLAVLDGGSALQLISTSTARAESTFKEGLL